MNIWLKLFKLEHVHKHVSRQSEIYSVSKPMDVHRIIYHGARLQNLSLLVEHIKNTMGIPRIQKFILGKVLSETSITTHSFELLNPKWTSNTLQLLQAIPYNFMILTITIFCVLNNFYASDCNLAQHCQILWHNTNLSSKFGITQCVGTY